MRITWGAGMARIGGGITRGRIAAGLTAVALPLLVASPAQATITLSPDTTTITESGASATATFTVSRDSCVIGSDAIVPINLSNGTAIGGQDFESTATPASVTLGCSLLGDSKTFTVSALDDTTDEFDETFGVALGTPSADALGTPSSATVTIADDDPPPTVSVGAAQVAEGTGTGTTILSIPVTLSAASQKPVSVAYAVAPGTATAGSDYVPPVTPPDPTVQFSPGQTTRTIAVAVKQDDIDEPDETLTATLGTTASPTATNATIDPQKKTGTGTIVNDDAPTITLGYVAGNEGDTGATTFTFPVHLSNPSARTITVHVKTFDITSAQTPADQRATAGQDYTAIDDQVVTFAPGAQDASFDVAVTPDTAYENDEVFGVQLFGPSVGTLADTGLGAGTAIGAIKNDDPAPSNNGGGGSTGGGTTGGGSTGGGTTGGGTTGDSLGITTTPPGTGTGVFGIGAPTGGDSTDPTVTLGRIRYNGRRLTVSMACPATEKTCRATLTVFTVPAHRSKVKQLRRELKLGSRVLLIPGGQHASITISVGRRNRALIHRGRRVKVKAYAVVRDNAGNVGTASRAGTLKG